MASKNETLTDELKDTKDLLAFHKGLLSEALKWQQGKVAQIGEEQSQLLGQIDEQTKFLEKNKLLLDTSQISMATTMDETHRMHGNNIPVNLDALNHMQPKPVMKNKKLQTPLHMMSKNLCDDQGVDQSCQTEQVSSD